MNRVASLRRRAAAGFNLCSLPKKPGHVVGFIIDLLLALVLTPKLKQQ